jgi:hypothetical protein
MPKMKKPEGMLKGLGMQLVFLYLKIYYYLFNFLEKFNLTSKR